MAGRARKNVRGRVGLRGAISRKRGRGRGAGRSKAPKSAQATEVEANDGPPSPSIRVLDAQRDDVRMKEDDNASDAEIREGITSALKWYTARLFSGPSAETQVASPEWTDFHENVLRGFLETLGDALAARSVAASVTDFPEAPKLLLYISNDPAALVDPPICTMLCNCLLQYTRADTTLPPAASAAKAKEWATTILSGMVNGEGPPRDAPIPTNEESDSSAMEHVLPTCPAEVLNLARLEEHAGALLRGIRALSRSFRDRVASYPMLLTAHPERSGRSLETEVSNVSYEMFRSVCSEVALMLKHPKGLPLAEAAIDCAGTMPVPLTGSEKLQLPLPISFARRLIARASDESLFDAMDPRVQALLIRLDPQVLEFEEQRARDIVSRHQPFLTFQHEAEIHEALGRAAAEDLTIQWRWMDNLKRDMLSQNHPFSILNWPDRWFHRAAHGATVREIARARNSAGVDSSKLLNVAPLYRRFSTQLRSLVSALEVYGRRLCPTSAGVHAVEHALTSLCDPFNNFNNCDNVPLLLPVDAQVAILAMESELQIIFASAAMCGFAAPRHDRDYTTVTKICRIALAVDAARMPGGQLVATGGEFNGRVERAKSILASLLQCDVANPHGGTRVERYTSKWEDLEVSDSLVAALAVGASATVSASAARSGSHWLGELLRACELVQARNSLCQAEARKRVSLVFSAALKSALALADLTSAAETREHRDVGDLGLFRVDKPALKKREEVWNAREKSHQVE